MYGSTINTSSKGRAEAASTVGDAAQTAASGAGDAALGTAVSPVLNLLKQGEADLKGGNLAAAVTTMGGFAALWATAGPLIKPLAGDKWPAIEAAANAVSKTFANGTPSVADAGTAIQGLLGPLSALVAK
jgi:hypothetical protein